MKKRAALAGAAALAIAALVFLRRDATLPHRVIVARLLEGVEERGAAGALHAWSADEIQSVWSHAGSGEDRILRSPALELGSLDEVDSIVVRFPPSVPARHVLLLWSTSESLSREDSLRNRRAIWPAEERVVSIRGKDLRGDEPSPIRHLFLHLSGAREVRSVVESISVVSVSDRASGRARVAVEGEMRDVLVLRTPAEWTRAIDVPRDAELRFGLHVPSASSVRARLELGAEMIFEEEIASRGWTDFTARLPEARGVELTLGVSSEETATQVLVSDLFVTAPAGPPARPNVVLYVVDTLRADALGAYGSESGSSPFLDDLALESVVFDRFYAAASWTKPSVASLMTSLHPQTHGLGARYYTDPLPDSVATLPELLGAQGYLTAQFSANPFSGTLSNLDRGFDRYFAPDAFGSGDAKPTAALMNERILPWIEEHAGDRFFLYVQSMDPHPPLGEGGYTAAVRANDAAIERLYRQLALAGSTLFVVTSDHGEAFGERGAAGHGHSVYDEEVRVPFLLHWKDRLKPHRSGGAAHHVDVLPTLLELASIPFDPSRVQGQSLASGERDGPVFVSRFTYPEDPDFASDRGEVHAAIDMPFKLIVPENGEPELYDLVKDPYEERNLAGERPDVIRALSEELDRFLARQAAARLEPAAYRPPSPRVLEQLRKLGYLR